MISRRHVAGLAMALLLVGCQDILKTQPPDSINSANFFATKDDAIAAINGAYQPLQWPKLYNMRMWTTDIIAGNSVVGAGGGTDGIETKNLADFVALSSNPGVLDLWRGPWPGILRANLVLAKVPGMTLDDALKSRILGEAHFLRALYYFNLVRFFGGVPKITEPQNPGDDIRPVRAPASEIYDEIIIPDLEAAMTLLPPRESYAPEDVGRASKGSATGLLAEVYLTLGNWQQVVDLSNQVEALGYTLNANYAWNFDPAHENGPESLFEVQYIGKTSYDFWSNENQAAWHSTFMGPRNSGLVAGGWGWNQPTQEFVDSYEPGDLRKDVTILYEGGPAFDGQPYSAAYSTTGYNVRKFLVPRSVAGTYDADPLNFPVLRFAEILLMRAEALNELGRTSEAEEPLNRVRRRAGLPDLTGLSQDAFRTAVLHERRMELAFEGKRWFDLVRVNGGQYGLDFLHSIGKVNASHDRLLLPIPQLEIDANPNLTQNPGY
ncbi:MAG TPA: RagB/SusD family nutrient uptake outer membrane protein [Gemmatimonadaceae bacterium]